MMDVVIKKNFYYFNLFAAQLFVYLASMKLKYSQVKLEECKLVNKAVIIKSGF